MSTVLTLYSVLVVERPCVALGQSTLLVRSELLAHSSLSRCASAIMTVVAFLLASRALRFTLGSRFAKAVSNQAINCFLAVSSCTLGSELRPYLGVLVTLKLPSSLRGRRLVSTDLPLAAGSGLDVTFGFKSCSSGLIRYCLGLNTLLGIQGCPSQQWMSGQGIFIQDLYHQLDLPSDMLIFWPASLSWKCVAIQHTVGNTHSLFVVPI